jgi:tRNA uridine 5-carboxymethylaminomethyl modification enzyme
MELAPLSNSPLEIYSKFGIQNSKFFSLLWNIEIEVKYKGYIDRALNDIEKFKELENIEIPHNLDFRIVHGLSNEIKEKFIKLRPRNLGQAQRISGVTPSAIFALMVFLKKNQKSK